MPSTCAALTSVFCCKQRTDSVAIGAHHGVGKPSIPGCSLDDGQPACQQDADRQSNANSLRIHRMDLQALQTLINS